MVEISPVFLFRLMKPFSFFELIAEELVVQGARGATNTTGDYSGKDFYIGNTWGFGNYRQLANPQAQGNLKDAEQEREDYYNPEEDEDFYNRRHLGSLPNSTEDINTESFTDPNRIIYGDLPGMRMNLLANQKKNVPPDKDPQRDFPEENQPKQKLYPDGKDGKKPEYWPPDQPLDSVDPVGEELDLRRRSNPSINDPNTTTQANRGMVTRNAVSPQLVKQYNQLDDPEDVETLPGSLGKVIKPKRFVPMNEKKIKTLIDNAVFEAVIAEKAPPGWSEEKMMKLKASLRKQGKNEELAFPIAWSIYNKSQE